MGIGDWGLGIGDWGLGPIPNPQSPIPIFILRIKIININILFYYNKKIIIFDFLNIINKIIIILKNE